MSRIVGPVGPENAKIMLIGEAPSELEEKEGKPFVGQSGLLLNRLLDKAGLNREDVRITNLIQYRPPNNNFKVFYTKGKPTPELLEAHRRLSSEISKCKPNVIVPLGNEAMKAVLGFQGVSLWRGSVLEVYAGKVIPTYHPAAVLREWTLLPAVMRDFERIAENSHFPDVRQTKRDLIINPSFEEVIHELARIKEEEWVAFDIETESSQISCISFSSRLHRAICIPFFFGASGSVWSEAQEEEIWKGIKEVLEREHPRKIAHNGLFDVEWLRLYDISARLDFDTMLAFHTLYLELEKSLAFVTSLYTDHPYYKYKIDSNSMDEYFTYNATDACLTYECFCELIQELRESKLESFYYTYVHSLIDPLLTMQLRGVRFDREGRNALRREYRKEIEHLREKLTNQVGYELNVSSHKQMTKWLYTELGIKPKYKKRKTTGETTESADEETLNEIYEEHKHEALKTILDIRGKEKLVSTYLDINLDPDDRIRCSYNISGTETGRLSSGRSTRETGTNLQNIPSGRIKQLFLADEGKLLINADLSQAEARIVAYVSGEKRLIEVFESGGDIHKKNASAIFNKKESEVTDEERQLAKRVVHASNYGMGPKTFAKTAGITQAEAQRLLNQYFATYPRIKLWHTQIKADLGKRRYLTTPLGRKRYFYNEWGEQTFKEGLAFIPQSTVADIMNRALVSMHSLGLELLLQVHDSVLLQCAESELDKTVSQVRECMRVPVPISGQNVYIPSDVKVGRNWDQMVKYSQLQPLSLQALR